MEVLLAVSAGDTISRDTELQQKLKVAWIYIVAIYISPVWSLRTFWRGRESFTGSPWHSGTRWCYRSTATTNRLSSIFYHVFLCFRSWKCNIVKNSVRPKDLITRYITISHTYHRCEHVQTEVWRDLPRVWSLITSQEINQHYPHLYSYDIVIRHIYTWRVIIYTRRCSWVADVSKYLDFNNAY